MCSESHRTLECHGVFSFHPTLINKIFIVFIVLVFRLEAHCEGGLGLNADYSPGGCRYTVQCDVHCKALHFVVLCSLKNAVLPFVLLTTNTVCRCSSISACIYH
jgi:hypothetical protein